MLRVLEGLRNGTVDRQSMIVAETTRRSYALELSKYKDVEDVCSASVNAIDLELTDGRFLLSGAADGSLYIHDLHNFSGMPQFTAKAVCKIDKAHRYSHKYTIECVQWYPFDNGMFTTSGMDKILKLWDANTMQPAESFSFEGRVFQHHLSSLPTKHYLISVASSINQILLVDIKSGSSIHELRGHKSSVLTCRWSPRDEHLLATGSCDNRILLWDVRAAKSCLQSLDQHNGKGKSSREHSGTAHNGYVNGLCFSEDGLFLISLGTDNRLRLWNTLTGRNELVNYGKLPNSTKKCVKFDVGAGCNPALVYVPSKGNVLIYEIHTGNKVGVLLGHYNSVSCCSYSPFFHELYSGGSDRNILIWSADDVQRTAYDEHLRLQNVSDSFSGKMFNFKRNPTTDNWSSDED